MKVSTILDQIDDGAIALPVFQRGYAWNRYQVRGLMGSLYRRHPVGSLLSWVTRTENADRRGSGPLSLGYVRLLLDRQQRITSLYGIIRGKGPPFFEGNPDTFTGLYSNMKTQVFEFYVVLVTLLIDEDEEVKRIASQAGFRFHTDTDSLKQYVEEQILHSQAVF